MSEARALLKAKRQEVRINHPYASYNASGQLKCSICTTLVKHASAWEGHLGSKAHRTNIIRLREEEKRQRGQTQRPAIVQEATEVDEEQMTVEPVSTSKRKVSDEDTSDSHSDKRRKVETFPSDFFSDPSRAPVLLSEDEGSDVEGANASTEAQSSAGTQKTTVDLEYERFQRGLSSTVDPEERYNRATIVAEPMVVSSNASGFQDEATVDISVEQKEEELRQKRDQDERELIMDRLLEEERAQEDADTRVLILKNRVETFRKKRQEAKANKIKASS